MDAYDSMFLVAPDKGDEVPVAQNGKLRELKRRLHNIRMAALQKQILTEDNSPKKNKIEKAETL